MKVVILGPKKYIATIRVSQPDYQIRTRLSDALFVRVNLNRGIEGKSACGFLFRRKQHQSWSKSKAKTFSNSRHNQIHQDPGCTTRHPGTKVCVGLKGSWRELSSLYVPFLIFFLRAYVFCCVVLCGVLLSLTGLALVHQGVVATSGNDKADMLSRQKHLGRVNLRIQDGPNAAARDMFVRH
jgi:hypothetical protein